MLVKSVVYISQLKEYHIQGYCGHTLTMSAREFENYPNPVLREHELYTRLCRECEAEFANMAKILHFEYRNKVGE